MCRNKNFVIGGIKDKWFFVDDDDKRRISAKNFQLIKMLEENEVDSYIGKINLLKEIESKIIKIKYFQEKFSWDFYKHSSSGKEFISSFIKDLPEYEILSKKMNDTFLVDIEILKQQQEKIIQELRGDTL